jgi:carbon-monoxide dehydrogenase medium subunit
VRNLASVGGNLFTPPPGGDVATALLALDASVEIAGPGGTRTLALADFWTGFMTTALAPDELVTGLVVPLDDGRDGYQKLGRKASNTPAVVTVAIHATFDGDAIREVRVALGAVGPYPTRAKAVEAALAGHSLGDAAIEAAAEAAESGTDPATDEVASDWYRRRMTRVVVARALRQLAAPADKGA